MKGTCIAVNIRQLEAFTEADFETISQIYSIGFAKHPFHVISTRNRPELWARAQAYSALTTGEMYVAEMDGKTVAAAGVFPPGTALFHHKEHDEIQLDSVLADQLGPDLKKWFDDHLIPEYTSNCERAFGRGGKLANYHLQGICVLPEYQRLGIARELVEFIQRKAHSQGMAVSLETGTPTNTAIYKRLGFELNWEMGLKGPKPQEEQLEFFFMSWRP